MGHINQPTWVPAANIPSPLKRFLGLFSDIATSLILADGTLQWTNILANFSLVWPRRKP